MDRGSGEIREASGQTAVFRFRYQRLRDAHAPTSRQVSRRGRVRCTAPHRTKRASGKTACSMLTVVNLLPTLSYQKFSPRLKRSSEINAARERLIPIKQTLI